MFLVDLTDISINKLHFIAKSFTIFCRKKYKFLDSGLT